MTKGSGSGGADPSTRAAEISGAVVLEPRPGSLLEGSLWHPDPSTLSGGAALRVLEDIGRARSFLAALEALAVERLRLACVDEARRAAEQAASKGPERFGGDVAHALAVSEVAVAEGISEFAAARLVNASEALCGPQLAVLTRLEGGLLSEAHARVITDETATLPESVAEEFGLECLRRLETRGGRRRAPGEFRKAVRSLRERMHPESVRARRVRAERDRGVWLRPEPDGMCTLSAFLPAEAGLAAFNRVDALARSARAADQEEGRTLPQLRADALAGLLISGLPVTSGDARGLDDPAELLPADAESEQDTELRSADAEAGRNAAQRASAGAGSRRAIARRRSAGAESGHVAAGAVPGAPVSGVPVSGVAPGHVAGVGGRAAEIVVHISAESLLGATDEPAELEGYGPIDAETARDLAVAASTWQMLSVGANGVALSLGRTAYRPSKGLRRFIEYRDGDCQFPCCTLPMRRGEIDHIIEWQGGGTTDAENLQALCPKHHALKSLGLWKAERVEGQAGSAGDILWTSPLGAHALAGPTDRELGSAPNREPGSAPNREPGSPPNGEPGSPTEQGDSAPPPF